MNAKQLAKALLRLKPELQEKEIKVMAPNGEMFSGEIKFVTVEPYNLELSKENVDYIWLHYQNIKFFIN